MIDIVDHDIVMLIYMMIYMIDSCHDISTLVHSACVENFLSDSLVEVKNSCTCDSVAFSDVIFARPTSSKASTCIALVVFPIHKTSENRNTSDSPFTWNHKRNPHWSELVHPSRGHSLLQSFVSSRHQIISNLGLPLSLRVTCHCLLLLSLWSDMGKDLQALLVARTGTKDDKVTCGIRYFLQG